MRRDLAAAGFDTLGDLLHFFPRAYLAYDGCLRDGGHVHLDGTVVRAFRERQQPPRLLRAGGRLLRRPVGPPLAVDEPLQTAGGGLTSAHAQNGNSSSGGAYKEGRCHG